MSVKLLSLIMFIESEADRLEASAVSVFSPEAHAYALQRAKMARDITKVLDLVLEHEDEFLALLGKKTGATPRRTA